MKLTLFCLFRRAQSGLGGYKKKTVADADFIPKPKVLKTGTDGDWSISFLSFPKSAFQSTWIGS
jgi:hypothetical protein